MTGKNESLLDKPPVNDSEALFRGLFENSIDAIQILDNFTFVECNQATVEILHAKNKEEVLSTHPSELSPEFQPDGRPSGEKADEMIRTALEQGGHRFDWVHRRVDGEDFQVEVMLTPVNLGDKTILYSSWRDIADRKLAEQRLNESEERYRRLSEASAEGIVIHDEGILLDANELFAKMFGYEQSEVIGMPAMEFLTPETRGITAENIRSGYERPYEVMGLRKDGSTFPVEITGKAIPYEGRTVRVTALRDITERKRSEAEVREAQQLLNSFLENFPDAAWAKDLEGHFLIANRYLVENIYGTTTDKVIGKTVYDTFPKDVADFVWSSEKRLLETGESIAVEEDIPQADGQVYNKITTKFPLYDAEDNIIGLGGVLIDITERKQAEDELLQQRENFRLVADFTYDWEYWLDTDNKYAYVSPSVKRITGHEAEEFMQIPHLFVDIAHPDDKHILEEHMHEFHAAQSDQAGEVELRIIRPDGSECWLSHLCQPVYDANGMWLGRRGSNRDITEQKQLETEIRQAFEHRGYQVQISTEISQEIAEASELTELFDSVVNLTKERLGYYHTQLLRYDPTLDAVVLISGYGNIGQQMIAQGHRMPLGSGLIGTAAETGDTVMRPDLAADPDWHANPLLPETRGEVAVPIKLGDQVLGVLDVQSDTANNLTEDDRLLLEGLCGQIAIAMEQTRLRQEMEERLREINRLYRAMSREGWKSYTDTTTLPEGFQYDQAGMRAIDNVDDQESLVTVPLTVPGGHTIGTLAITDDPDNPLSTEDQAFLEQVSEQVALALESARLFEQTQAALETVQESEAQLSEALEIAKLGYWEYDFANDEFILTDNFYAIFHTTAEKMDGYRMSSKDYSEKFVHPEDAAMVGEEIERSLAVEDLHFTTQLEHRILYQDGGIGYISVNINLEKDVDGNILRWYGANQDITDRKVAEEAVRQAQERAQTILETVTLPMVITRISDNILTFANQPAADIVGMELEEFVNQPAPNFYYDPEERTLFIQAVQDQGFVNNMQIQLVRSDQSTFWSLLSARVFEYQGEPSILTTITDISERIAAQEATARRATELATVAEVGTTISTILEEQPLLETVVQQTQERFKLYHCHIFLADAKNQTLQVKACGWEEGSPHVGTHGDTLIHTDQEQSLVAQAARGQKAVIVNDVRSDPNWLPNELLPETRSEMAVPLIAGNQVLGVLDIQSDEVDRFTEEDISIMTTLASQVAVALQNSRTYAQTQQQAEYEAMINQISQQIQSTTSVENALQVAIRELGRALGAKRTNIQLGLPNQKKIG